MTDVLTDRRQKIAHACITTLIYGTALRGHLPFGMVDLDRIEDIYTATEYTLTANERALFRLVFHIGAGDHIDLLADLAEIDADEEPLARTVLAIWMGASA